METELLTVYNVISTYKASLIRILDKIDQNLLLVVNSFGNVENEREITRKYKLSIEMVTVIRSYVDMLHIGEHVVHDLQRRLVELDSDIEPERETNDLNPFLEKSLSQFSSCSTPPILTFFPQTNDASNDSESETITHFRNDVTTVERQTQTEVSVEIERNDNESQTVVDVVKVEKEEREELPPLSRVDTPEVDDNESVGTSTIDKIFVEGAAVDLDTTRTDLDTSLESEHCDLTNKHRTKVSFKLPSKQKSKLSKTNVFADDAAVSKTSKSPLKDWKENAIKFFQNNKLRKQNERKSKEKRFYDVWEDDLTTGERCNFCHIVSPSEFYLRNNQDLFESMEDFLNKDMNGRSCYIVNGCQSKHEAKANIGTFCFAFIQSRNKWLRAQIIDWMIGEPETISIHLIDYGITCLSSFTYLRPMTEFYSTIPRMAFKCEMAAIYPLQKNQTWNKGSIDYFVKLSEMQKMTKFTLLFVHKNEDCFAVDLIKDATNGINSIGHLLVESGYARLFDIANEHGDFSTYSEDDLEDYSNINELITGYDAKDEGRICRFTDKTGKKCFKGAQCKLEHAFLSEDGITTDKILTTKKAFVERVLPSNGTNITILITGYINTCQFYAHLVTNPVEGNNLNREFINLFEMMNTNNIIQTYKPLKLRPELHELVLVKEGSDWLRGQCIGYGSDNKIEVFVVDWGIRTIKEMKELRQMKDDFLHIPFEAVNCILDSCQEKSNVKENVSLQFFNDFMYEKQFTGYVVNSGLPLRVNIVDSRGISLGQIIKNYGIGQDRIDLSPAEDTGIRIA